MIKARYKSHGTETIWKDETFETDINIDLNYPECVFSPNKQDEIDESFPTILCSEMYAHFKNKMVDFYMVYDFQSRS